MGRKATDRKGYSKSRGQSELAAAVAAVYPLSAVKQDVGLRRYVERELGYPWRVLEREYGASMGRLDADVVVMGKEPLILEFHGRQHFEFVAHFHVDSEGWKEAKERDRQKVWLAQRLGIPFVTFRYDETPTEDLVRVRVAEAREGMEPLPGYQGCSSCGRTFLPGNLDAEGVCDTCRREERDAERRRQQAEIAPGLTLTDEEKDRAREARREDRARATAARQPQTEEQKQRQDGLREEQRSRERAIRESRKAQPVPPEEQERRDLAAQQRKDADRDRRQARAAEQKAVRKAAGPSEWELTGRERQKAARKEADDRYKASDAYQEAKERDRAWRKSARSSLKRGSRSAGGESPEG